MNRILFLITIKKASMTRQKNPVVPADDVIGNKIYLIRGKKVMLDKDLAELYQVTTANLNKAVRRNVKRFPADFMFQLSEDEHKDLIFQNGTSSWGGTRKWHRNQEQELVLEEKANRIDR